MLPVLLLLQLAPVATVAPPVPSSPPPPRPPVVSHEPAVHVFGRIELGVGPAGFSPNTSALSEMGYGGAKMWAMMDGAYMIHRHVGLGAWAGINRRALQSQSGPGLNEVGYFLGLQAPILVVGQRDYALHILPRVGWLAGQLEIDDDEDTPLQHTAIWGGAVSFSSFSYHMSMSVGLMRAQAGAPGALGRDHDFGGFYASLGGTIDG